MNRVLVSATEIPLPEWAGSIKGYTRKVLDQLGRDKWDISVLLCSDRTIAALNSKYRGKAQATDILSFAMDEGENFPQGSRRAAAARRRGDIAISLDTLRSNACRFKVSEDEELRRLLIHGILHLGGMDHRTNSSNEPMLQLQERILSDLAQVHIIGRKT